jgi:hypothetical protein
MFTHLSHAVPYQNLIRSKHGLMLFPRECDRQSSAAHLILLAKADI